MTTLPNPPKDQAPAAAAPAPAGAAAAVRHFGRFQLLRLLGKSMRSMMWLVSDPRSDQELVLAMPRQKPGDDAGLQRWLSLARQVSRIEHPGLAHAVEVGEQERWPFIAYDRGASVLLSERIGSQGLPPTELVSLLLPALQGLAQVHEAGRQHLDLHAGMLQLPEAGGSRLMGLGVCLAETGQLFNQALAQRQAAEQDVLALGLVLHHALAGAPALGLSDVMQAVARLPPWGRDAVSLPRLEIQPLPAPLRAIINRATDRQQRQRYRSARSFERALSGWLKTADSANGGPLALLMDRVRSQGLLPAMPGGAARARSLLYMDKQGMPTLADVVLQDVGLSFELLRQVNSAGVRAAMAPGSGPILTVRRAMTLIGLDAVRRAGQVLKPWPGPLNEEQATALDRQIDLAHRAGHAARLLRPAGYDAELVYLLTLMQRLGRLVVQYHFPDEAGQIQRLMQAAPGPRASEPDEPGMVEELAAFTVLGFDIEALGQAVGRHWGMDESALLMMRRLPLALPVHASKIDADLLRCTASCANELIDATGLPEPGRQVALQRTHQRYARVLHVSLEDLQNAAKGVSSVATPEQAVQMPAVEGYQDHAEGETESPTSPSATPAAALAAVAAVAAVAAGAQAGGGADPSTAAGAAVSTGNLRSRLRSRAQDQPS